MLSNATAVSDVSCWSEPLDMLSSNDSPVLAITAAL